jgi:hypothetical protein
MKNILFFLVVVSSAAFGQIQGADGVANVSNLSSGDMFRTFDNRYKGLEGFPTVFETPLPGVIYLKNGETMLYQKVNYDVLSNEVLVVRNSIEMVVKNHLVTKFSLIYDEDSINFIKVVLPTGTRFVEQLIKGELNLYKVSVKAVQAPTNSGAYSSGSLTSKITEEIVYYWSYGDRPLEEITSKKKLLNDLEAATGKDFADFTKENKISLKQDNHLKKLFNHANRQIKV